MLQVDHVNVQTQAHTLVCFSLLVSELRTSNDS